MARFSELIKNIEKKSEIYQDVAFGAPASRADEPMMHEVVKAEPIVEQAVPETVSVPAPEPAPVVASVQAPAPEPASVPEPVQAAEPVNVVKPKPNAFLLTNILKKETAVPVVEPVVQPKPVVSPRPAEPKQPDVDAVSLLIETVETFFARGADALAAVTFDDIAAVVRRVASALPHHNTLLRTYQAMIEESPSYLVRHTCAVTVYSLVVAKAHRLSDDDLVAVGATALFHDIAMRDLPQVISLERELSAQERSVVQTHVSRAEAYMTVVSGMPADVIKAVAQHHERVDGSGYPERIDKRKVLQAARIVGFVDALVALCGHRAYRKRKTTVEAYKELLNNKNSFSRKVIKACIDHVGLYPVGSEVELNTGEHATVTAVNPQNALRPRVLPRPLNPDALQPKELDLARHTTIYIKTAL